MTDNLDKAEPGVLSRWSRRKAQQSSVVAKDGSTSTSVARDQRSIVSADSVDVASPSTFSSIEVGAGDLPDVLVDGVDTVGAGDTATEHQSIADATDVDHALVSGSSDEQVEPILTDEDMPEIESLSASSDVSMFFNEGVSKALRKAALAHIFKLPVYNIRDGLNDYDEDYTVFEPLGDTITCDMKFHARRRERERLERERLEQEQLEQARLEQEQLEQQPAEESLEDQVEDQPEQQEADTEQVDDNELIDNVDPVEEPQQIEGQHHNNHAVLADNKLPKTAPDSLNAANTPDIAGIKSSQVCAEAVDVSAIDRPHVTHKESV